MKHPLFKKRIFKKRMFPRRAVSRNARSLLSVKKLFFLLVFRSNLSVGGKIIGDRFWLIKIYEKIINFEKFLTYSKGEVKDIQLEFCCQCDVLLLKYILISAFICLFAKIVSS